MSDVILQVSGLFKHFTTGQSRLFGSSPRLIHAVDGVDLSLRRGETVALVGESGCGKSTLALTLMGLEEPTQGVVLFDGQDIAQLTGKERKRLHQRIQMIFQDPYESLNPTQTIGEIVEEPLLVHGLATDRHERAARVVQAIEDAGLKPARDYAGRYPHQLSGGQRQRVAIAAALVLEPDVLLADEPVSMLDVSIRAEIINLLGDLRERRKISVIFITHDLGTVGALADRVAVMYLGRIVEVGATREVVEHPQHPYTRALLSVIPVPNPRLRRERVILQGETPNPIDLPSGCRFHPRCPVAADACRTNDPEYVSVSANHKAACLLVKSSA